MHGDMVSIRDSFKNILGMKYDGKVTFKDHVRGNVSRDSRRNIILRLVKRVFMESSVLLCCYYAIVLQVL